MKGELEVEGLVVVMTRALLVNTQTDRVLGCH